MTYEEAYLKLDNKEDVIEEAKKDIRWALACNADRIPGIVKSANKVLSEKYKDNYSFEDLDD